MTNWNRIKDIFYNSYDKHNAEYIDMIKMIDDNHPEIVEFINSLESCPVYTEDALSVLKCLYNNFWYESNKPLVIRGYNDNN